MKSFDVKIVCQTAAFVDELSTEDKERLFNDPDFTFEREDTSRTQAQAESDVEYSSVDDVTPEMIAMEYREIVKEANSFLEIIRSRSKHLVYHFDKNERPDLYRCVNALFESPTPIEHITYDMYLKALRYIKDVGSEMGKEA